MLEMEKEQGNSKDLAIESESKKVNVCKRNHDDKVWKGNIEAGSPVH